MWEISVSGLVKQVNFQMKKLCIVLTGQLRLPIEKHVEIIENYKRQFRSWAGEPDVWYFTWKMDNKVDEEMLRSHVYRLFAEEQSPDNKILGQLGIPYSKQLNSYEVDSFHQTCRVGHYAIVYTPSYVFDRIVESGEEYEYAVRGRNDLYFETDTFDWYETVRDHLIIRKDKEIYISPPNYWCAGQGANDHLGFGKFSVVRNIWRYEPEEFKKLLSSSWNIESYVQEMINRNAWLVTVPVNSYVVIRKDKEWRLV